MSQQPHRWQVDVPTARDAGEWVEVHLRALAETYPQLPPGFVGQRRTATDRLVAALRAELADPGPARHLLVRGDAGRVVGIARSTVGREDWERRLLTGYPDADALGLGRPSGLLQLSSLYTVAGVHGGGAGAALFDDLVGTRAAYLWIMAGNDRAEAFYRRRGFVRVSANVPSGPTWYSWPMFQLARPAPS